MRATRDPNICFHPSRGGVTVAGKFFPHLTADDVCSPQEREDSYHKAWGDAQEYGQEVHRAMVQRLGRPLTTREKLTNVADKPPETKYSGSLSEPKDPSHNPWHTRLAELENTIAYTPGQKSQLAIRLKAAKQSAAEWDAKYASTLATEARNNDPALALARKHAAEYAEQLRLDGTVTVAQIDEHAERQKLVESDQGIAAVYWQSLGKAAPPAEQSKAPTLLEKPIE